MDTEKTLGSPDPFVMVLATATPEGVPRSRVVAIREIAADNILFFTQNEKRKAVDLLHNPFASATIWLAQQQKQIVLEGKVVLLNEAENNRYWESLTYQRQLLFSTYAPNSDQEIQSVADLEEKQKQLLEIYAGKTIPKNVHYIGFRLIPDTLYFYTLGIGIFSESLRYRLKEEGGWEEKMLSP